MSKKNRHKHVVTPPPAAAAEPVVEYRPSDQAAKYDVATPQYKYRVLAFRNDYVRLQEEVTKYLDDGWNLAGGLTTSVHADQYNVTTVFAQAVYRL